VLKRILRIKQRLLANHFTHMRKHVAIHLMIFLGIIAFVMAAIYAVFHLIFSYLTGLEIIGPLLMNHVSGMAFLAFFSMLIFSNLIVTLSTAYTSKEVDFYMSLPVAHSTIFSFRFIESVFYSSWAFAVLSVPMVIAMGVTRDAPFAFYAAMFAMLAPFLIIPAGLGALITMVLASLFPARKTFRMVILLGALGVAMALLSVRLMGLRSMVSTANLDNFQQVLGILQLGSIPLLPNAWLMNGMLAADEGRWFDFFLWFGRLLATALLMLQICAWLAPAIYYRGWRMAGESSSPRRSNGSRPFLGRFDWILAPLGPQIRAVVSKDIKVFWRDPAQWSQLMILFGLLFVYVANLRNVSNTQLQIPLESPFWKTTLSFVNLGAGCFILSILTTRFVYPMLSLEGKQFWTLGLAPLKRETVVWVKYWLCWFSTVTLTGALMAFSGIVLKVGSGMMMLSLATALLLSFGLTSISVGLGALTPNFKEDNPARIANGMGGTMNVFLSLGYVATVIALEIWPALLLAADDAGASAFPRLLAGGAAAAILAISGIAIIVPMRMGLRNWREMEF
jgi:ABC-2 type transport system permease protein